MRLIDADPICRGLNDWQYGDFARAGHEVEYNLIDKVLEGISAAPTIDAVPVVRCKDCKHRDPEDYRCDCGHDILWQLPRWGDWFCADGERKDSVING